MTTTPTVEPTRYVTPQQKSFTPQQQYFTPAARFYGPSARFFEPVAVAPSGGAPRGLSCRPG
jgi:hypothetical protein